MSGALVLFLAGLLGFSAGHKLLAPVRQRQAATRLTGLNPPLAALLLLAVASIEVLGAIALLLGELRPGGALVAALVWLAYALALMRRFGERLDCGCDLVARERPVDRFTVARPLLLAVLTIAVLLDPAMVWTLDSPFGAFALLALWFAAGELHSIPNLARVQP